MTIEYFSNKFDGFKFEFKLEGQVQETEVPLPEVMQQDLKANQVGMKTLKRNIEETHMIQDRNVDPKRIKITHEGTLDFEEMLRNIPPAPKKKEYENPLFESNKKYRLTTWDKDSQEMFLESFEDPAPGGSQTPQTLDFAAMEAMEQAAAAAAKAKPPTQTLDFAAMAALNLQISSPLDFLKPVEFISLKPGEEIMDQTNEPLIYKVNSDNFFEARPSSSFSSTSSQSQTMLPIPQIVIPPYVMLPPLNNFDPDIESREEALEKIYSLLNDHGVTVEDFNIVAQGYFEDDFAELESLPIVRIYEVIDHYSDVWNIDDRDSDPGVDIPNDIEYEVCSKENQLRDMMGFWQEYDAKNRKDNGFN